MCRAAQSSVAAHLQVWGRGCSDLVHLSRCHIRSWPCPHHPIPNVIPSTFVAPVVMWSLCPIQVTDLKDPRKSRDDMDHLPPREDLRAHFLLWGDLSSQNQMEPHKIISFMIQRQQHHNNTHTFGKLPFLITSHDIKAIYLLDHLKSLQYIYSLSHFTQWNTH